MMESDSPTGPSSSHGASGDGGHPDRLPAHPPTPHGYATQEPQRHILMSPAMVMVGGLLAFFTVVATVVVLPTTTYTPAPSANWLPLRDEALRGRAHYLANGCVYCHSGFVRPQDVFSGLYYLYPRAAEPGDYHGGDQSPNVLGSERTGPDLSQEAGNHPDSWHRAHYANPRNTTPRSIMPRFSFLTPAQVGELIAFSQSSGGKEGLLRDAAQRVGHELMRINMGQIDPRSAFPAFVRERASQGAYRAAGQPTDTAPSGLAWKEVWMVNSFERGYWLTPDPLPLTDQALLRGKAIFLDRCSGCHGMAGDGKGPAAAFFDIPPFDFTDPMKVRGAFASDGQMYHRILTAGKGTAMENFGTRLSVEDIWRVVLFLRTIERGSLRTKGTVPTRAMYRAWTPPPALLRYVTHHPIERSVPPAPDSLSPFAAAARWVAPGLAPEDTVLVGGKLAVTLAEIEALIRERYLAEVQRAYADAVARRTDRLPPLRDLADVRGVTFHAP